MAEYVKQFGPSNPMQIASMAAAPLAAAIDKLAEEIENVNAGFRKSRNVFRQHPEIKHSPS